MSHSITTHVRRNARVSHSGRDGLTVAHLREFLADCDTVGIPDEARVRVEDKLAGEGANRSGHVEAWHVDEADAR